MHLQTCTSSYQVVWKFRGIPTQVLREFQVLPSREESLITRFWVRCSLSFLILPNKPNKFTEAVYRTSSACKYFKVKKSIWVLKKQAKMYISLTVRHQQSLLIYCKQLFACSMAVLRLFREAHACHVVSKGPISNKFGSHWQNINNPMTERNLPVVDRFAAVGEMSPCMVLFACQSLQCCCELRMLMHPLFLFLFTLC